MIVEGQHILYVTEAEVIAYLKQDRRKQIKNSGFSIKKVIITTRRVLVFESLSNKLVQTEYQLTSTIGKVPIKAPEKEARISVNGFPEVWMSNNGLSCKVIIDEQPIFFKYLQKQGIQNIIKSTLGVVLLKNPAKQFYVLAMGSIHNAIRFSKALVCAQGWGKYQIACPQLKVKPNPMWLRILIEIISNDDSVVLIDPDLFVNGSNQQIQSFIYLLTTIPFAHCYHHRYSITTAESATYAANFIGPIQAKIHSLSLSNAHMTDNNLKIVLKNGLPNLLKLDLSHNSLSDEAFQCVNRLIKNGSKKLSYVNLSYNQIQLNNGQMLVELFKSAKTFLNLNLSHNVINDTSIDIFEKYILFSYNPPLEEINLSYNKFSRKGAWRLYVGNARHFKQHPYVTFIIYPIPVKSQVFGDYNMDFPRHNQTINLNMHSALIQQFDQESILRHTFQEIPMGARQTKTISFHRVLTNNVKLPVNRQELNLTLQISHRLQNFIYTPQPVEKIYETALELKRFPFEVPPITRQHFLKYLFEQFNEALLIRDHYSVKYLYKALKELGGDVQGYRERLQILNRRDLMYSKRAEAILNLQINQGQINDQLDEVTRQGLRLYLQGEGVQILYYLKYKRDQYIQKYLNEKLNPEHYLFNLMAKKNINAEQRVSERQFFIPYQIRLQKKINQNFYLHPWQANYQTLSQMNKQTFEQCLGFLENSDKKQKFAKYFDTIESRIDFIKNEFVYFSYNKFNISYPDLKINPCRLLYLYNNIKDTSLYLDIPIYVKKKPVTEQKTIKIQNPSWFAREYHIVNYLNINIQARKANFYNYPDIITKYNNQIFESEFNKIKPFLFQILKSLQVSAATKTAISFSKIVQNFKLIIDKVRHSLMPQEIKEEIYLHLIAWRRGKGGSNTEIINLLPAFTMYLKPPLEIQKYLIASILQNERVSLQDIPLCLSTNPNEPTNDHNLDKAALFVERNWIPPDNIFEQILQQKGQVTLEIKLLQRRKIIIKVAESITVGELMIKLIEQVEMNTFDKEHYWLYKVNQQEFEIYAFESRQHVGQILSEIDLKQNTLIVKRRIYSRELRFNYGLYGENMMNSLYYHLRFEYLFHNFFINDNTATDIASIIFIVEVVEKHLQDNKQQGRLSDELTIEKIIYKQSQQLDNNLQSYVHKSIFSRLMRSKDDFINQMRAKISERVLKRQHHAISQMKISLIKAFSGFPQFMSTNHRVQSNEQSDMRLSINPMYIYIENESSSERINLQKLVTIIPKSKYLLLYYHKHENLQAQVPMFAPQKTIFAILGDILTYCAMRIKMSSINLYEIYHFQNNERNNSSRSDKQEKQRSLKKIAKMSQSLMRFKEIIYFNRNNYIKSEVNRKLYANKTDKREQFDTQMDEQEVQETINANKKIFALLFPTQQTPIHEEIQELPTPHNQNSFSQYSWNKEDYKMLDRETNLRTQPKRQQDMRSSNYHRSHTYNEPNTHPQAQLNTPQLNRQPYVQPKKQERENMNTQQRSGPARNYPYSESLAQSTPMGRPEGNIGRGQQNQREFQIDRFGSAQSPQEMYFGPAESEYKQPSSRFTGKQAVTPIKQQDQERVVGRGRTGGKGGRSENRRRNRY